MLLLEMPHLRPHPDDPEVNWDTAKRLCAARDGGKCVRCLGEAVDVHHRRVRGMGGSSDPDITGMANLVSLCRICHDHVHANPAESYETGFLVKTGYDPAGVPLKIGSGYLNLVIWLSPDGGMKRMNGVCGF